jgi:hypothetical protein
MSYLRFALAAMPARSSGGHRSIRNIKTWRGLAVISVSAQPVPRKATDTTKWDVAGSEARWRAS